MKLKLDEQGTPALEDGKPVYVADDGTERPVDVAAMSEALAKANAQAQTHRERAQQAEASLKLFRGLDPKAAREAIAFREALGEDVDPSKVTHEIAALKAERAGLTTQVEELQAKTAKADKTIDELTLGAQIRDSEFISAKVAPALRDPALFRAAYGPHLDRDEGGRVVVKDAAGNTIMSEANPGQPATLDEALPRIVTNPHHLAAGNASGSGERSAAGGNGAPAKTGKKKAAEMSNTEAAAALRELDGDVTKFQELYG